MGRDLNGFFKGFETAPSLLPYDTPVKQASKLHGLGARWTAGMRDRALQC